MWWMWLACAPSGLGPEVEEALAEAVTTARKQADAPAAVLYVASPDGELALAEGESDTSTGALATPEQPFRLGSITKTYAAALVMLLVEDGVLSLEDTVSDWVTVDMPSTDIVTVRMLLEHSSGYEDYIDEIDLIVDLDEVWTPRELLALVGERELLFAPNTDHFYANTNFVLLGLIVEEATGRSWGELCRERLLDPLGLERTVVPTLEGEPAGMARGYFGDGADEVDVTDVYHPTVAWMAGEVVAPAEEVGRWAQALYGGEVLSEASLSALTTEVWRDESGYGYALGTQVYDEGNRVGHAGLVVGFQSRLSWVDDQQLVVVSLMNDFTAEADLLDEAARAVLETPR